MGKTSTLIFKCAFYNQITLHVVKLYFPRQKVGQDILELKREHGSDIPSHSYFLFLKILRAFRGMLCELKVTV